MANRATWQDTEFHVGDKIAVHHQFRERGKIRTQVFGGIVIGIKGRGENKSFTVRRITIGNIGAELIWPLASPLIKKIVVEKKGKVRRAKLYYLRKGVKKRGKSR